MRTQKLLRRKAASDYLRETHGLERAPSTLAKLAVIGGGPTFRRAGLGSRESAGPGMLLIRNGKSDADVPPVRSGMVSADVRRPGTVATVITFC